MPSKWLVVISSLHHQTIVVYYIETATIKFRKLRTKLIS